jgi:hypothetical protein
MAYKVFSNGDALTGGELNTFLMNQSVISFATTTARDAAIPAPLEGQLVWLEDSNKYVYYTGSAWADLIVAATPPGTGNAIINGAFDIWQRGTSFTTSVYTADRFAAYVSDGTVTNSRQTFTPGAAPVAGYESAFHFRSAISGQTLSTAASFLSQKIEDVRSFAGQTITISFWAKAASGTPKIGLEYVQDFGTGGSPSADVTANFATPTISTSWARYTATLAVPSITGKTLGTVADSFLEFGFWFSAGSTFNTRSGSIGIQNNTIDIWGVQVEAGSTATAFKRNGLNIADELASCQRYYYRSTASTPSPYGVFTNAFGANSTTQVFTATRLPVTMRVIPTSVDFSTLQLADGTNLYTVTGCVLDPNTSTADYVSCGFTVSSGLTQYRPYVARANNSANGFLGFSAEL